MGRNNKLFQKRRAASRESLQRKAASRNTNTRVLIVCEGVKTELLYFQELVSKLRLVAVDVEISADGGSAPRSVVQYAEQRSRSEGQQEDAGYDAVFCVFDKDTHETFEEAKSRVLQLRKEGVFPAVSDVAITSIPSFEYWFILHFGYERSPFVGTGAKTAGAAVVSALKSIDGFANYEKNLSLTHIGSLLERTDAAIRNSERATKDAEATGEWNPSTLVHNVVEYLRGLAKKSAKHE